MSNGDGENGTVNKNNPAKASSLLEGSGGGHDFGRAVAKIAVAQVCASTGFQGSRPSSLDTLADVLIRYLQDLGKASHFFANLSGRTSCNVFDIIRGVEDIESSHSFLDASGVVKEIRHFVSTTEENPFTRQIPSFPIGRQPKLTPTFAQVGKAPAGKHIPDWLPVFPDAHTYIHTPVWKERAHDLKADKIEQVRQRRKAEQSLLSLQQRLASNGAAIPRLAVHQGFAKRKQVSVDNPFLSPPLPFGEKQVSNVGAPQVSNVAVPEETAERKSLSILGAFAPAIEAAKHGSFDSGATGNMVLLSKRPTVHFTFGVGTNSVVPQVGSSLWGSKTGSWFLRSDDEDDKKRRAEMILKESMEKPDGLPQL